MNSKKMEENGAAHGYLASRGQGEGRRQRARGGGAANAVGERGMCQQMPDILGACEGQRKMLALTGAATAESLIVASNSDEQWKYARPHIGTTRNGTQTLHTAYCKKNERKRRGARLSDESGARGGRGTASKGGRDGEQGRAGQRAPWEHRIRSKEPIRSRGITPETKPMLSSEKLCWP